MVKYEVKIPIEVAAARPDTDILITKQGVFLAKLGAAVVQIMLDGESGMGGERKTGIWVESKEAETTQEWIVTLEKVPMPFVRKTEPDTVEVQADERCTWKPKPMAAILGVKP